jgi:hypothetical protein
MSSDHEDTGEIAVAFVSGILVGVATTLLFVRIRNSRALRYGANDDEYRYDGGDLFI